MLLEGRIDVVTFTSPSAVRNFSAIYGADQAVDLLKNTVVADDRAGHRGSRDAGSASRHRGTGQSRRCRRWSMRSPRTVAAREAVAAP